MLGGIEGLATSKQSKCKYVCADEDRVAEQAMPTWHPARNRAANREFPRNCFQATKPCVRSQSVLSEERGKRVY
jgi:hypothetical protein